MKRLQLSFTLLFIYSLSFGQYSGKIIKVYDGETFWVQLENGDIDSVKLWGIDAPELKHLPNGTAVANFSVEKTENWSDKKTGEKMSKTEWHKVVIFGKQAENCNQYLSKGSKVYVEGKITTRSWDDEKTGTKRYSTEINANSVQFLSTNKETNTALKDAHGKQAEYQVHIYIQEKMDRAA